MKICMNMYIFFYNCYYFYHILFIHQNNCYPISIAIALLLVWFPKPIAAGSGFKLRWGTCLQSFISCLRKLKHELNKILLEIEIFGYLNVVAEKHCL